MTGLFREQGRRPSTKKQFRKAAQVFMIAAVALRLRQLGTFLDFASHQRLIVSGCKARSHVTMLRCFNFSREADLHVQVGSSNKREAWG